MKLSDSDKTYADASELVRMADLQGIRFFELHAKVTTELEENDDTPDLESGDSDKSGTSAQNWSFFIQVSPDALNLRARLDLQGPDAEYVVDAAVFFNIKEPGHISKSVTSDFVNRVAILSLYPFVREALHETARKIGAKQPLLGLYHPGELRIDLNETEELS